MIGFSDQKIPIGNQSTINTTLAVEQLRWFDLKRTKKLETQIVYNKNAVAYFKSDYYLRPIPAPEMQTISNTSTTPGTGFWQNPGC